MTRKTDPAGVDGVQTVQPSSRPPRSTRHYAMLVLGGLAILLLLGSGQWQYTLSMDTLASARQQRERMRNIDALLIRMLDAETGVRGYLAAGDRAYLEPYRSALAQISSVTAALRANVAEDVEARTLFEALEGKVARKLDVLAAAAASGKGDAWSVETTGTGKVLMDDIRELVGDLKALSDSRADASIARSVGAIRFSRWLTLVLGACAMLLLLAVHVQTLRQFRLRAQIARMLREENRRLEEQVDRRTAELSTMASYLANVREEEKRRLARELHDELGAILTSAKMDAGWIRRKLDPATMDLFRERFDRLVLQLDSGIALKRRIIDNLHPPLLNELGLVASLQSMIEELRASSSTPIEFDSPDTTPPIAPEKALAFYRIAQEALTNVRKYARARSVAIGLEFGVGWARLHVTDDGCGFDPGATIGTHGLDGMRYRVRMFGGRFDVRSAPGKGTRVEAELPL